VTALDRWAAAVNVADTLGTPLDRAAVERIQDALDDAREEGAAPFLEYAVTLDRRAATTFAATPVRATVLREVAEELRRIAEAQA